MAERMGTDRIRVVQYGKDGRLLQATCAQALGCIGQRTAALGLTAETSAVLTILLDELEEGNELPMPGGSPTSPKWLTKENAALGLVTTSSGLPMLEQPGIDSALLRRLGAALEVESETATDRYLMHVSCSLPMLLPMLLPMRMHACPPPTCVLPITCGHALLRMGVCIVGSQYALEGIARVGRATQGGDPLAVAQRRMFEKLLEKRWCPFTDAQSQF